jgi:t-SNARE complex subunit (syntaxin)
MGWLSSILRALAPIAVEHGSQVLRDSIKGRTAQSQGQASGADVVQQLASDVEQLKAYALQLKSDLEILNAAIAAREERLRKWLLAIIIWNAIITVALVLVAVFALRH